MRNGNFVNQKHYLLQLGSYRTYEEWKLEFAQRFGLECRIRSYRTYEEWKHVILLLLSLIQPGSYRTYEEWKQELLLRQDNRKFVFLPYL